MGRVRGEAHADRMPQFQTYFIGLFHVPPLLFPINKAINQTSLQELLQIRFILSDHCFFHKHCLFRVCVLPFFKKMISFPTYYGIFFSTHTFPSNTAGNSSQSSLSSTLQNAEGFLSFNAATQPLAQGEYSVFPGLYAFLAHILGISITTYYCLIQHLSSIQCVELYLTCLSFLESMQTPKATLRMPASQNPECFPHALLIGKVPIPWRFVLFIPRNM